MSRSVSPRGLLLGTLGGLIGGAVGCFIFYSLLRFGLYGMMIPGAAVGLGVGWCSRERSVFHGILAGVMALGIGLFAKWSRGPFDHLDESFGFFLKNLHNLTPLSQIMLGLGVVFAYWFGQGRERFAPRRTQSETTEVASDSGRPPG